MRRLLLLSGGFVSLSLGIVGVFLPIVPTTPFLLLAAAAFVRSSKPLYDWLINHRILGLYIRSFLLYRAITIRAKVVSLVMLWLVILSSAFIAVEAWWIRILLLCVACGVSTYLIRLKTLSPEMVRAAETDRDSVAPALTADFRPD